MSNRLSGQATALFARLNHFAGTLKYLCRADGFMVGSVTADCSNPRVI